MTLIILITILTILFIHWFADAVMQTDYDAQNKSKSNTALLTHTITYSLIWAFATVVYYQDDWNKAIWFTGITLVTHTIIDYFTSRLNSYLWKTKQVHNFFVSVLFDQWLHYAQLFITFYLLQ